LEAKVLQGHLVLRAEVVFQQRDGLLAHRDGVRQLPLSGQRAGHDIKAVADIGVIWAGLRMLTRQVFEV